MIGKQPSAGQQSGEAAYVNAHATIMIIHRNSGGRYDLQAKESVSDNPLNVSANWPKGSVPKIVLGVP